METNAGCSSRQRRREKQRTRTPVLGDTVAITRITHNINAEEKMPATTRHPMLSHHCPSTPSPRASRAPHAHLQ